MIRIFLRLFTAIFLSNKEKVSSFHLYTDAWANSLQGLPGSQAFTSPYLPLPLCQRHMGPCACLTLSASVLSASDWFPLMFTLISRHSMHSTKIGLMQQLKNVGTKTSNVYYASFPSSYPGHHISKANAFQEADEIFYVWF